MTTVLHDGPQDHVDLLVIPHHGIAYSNRDHMTNQVRTTKYTWYNFLPFFLWRQLTTATNLYFMFIGFLQALKYTSMSKGMPTILIPLTLITITSGIRALAENIQAFHADKKRNSAFFWQVRPNQEGYLNNTKAEIENTAPPKSLLESLCGRSSRQDAIPLLWPNSSGNHNVGWTYAGGADGKKDHEWIHPLAVLNHFFDNFLNLPTKLAQRWISWSTIDPTRIAMLPSLVIPPGLSIKHLQTELRQHYKKKHWVDLETRGENGQLFNDAASRASESVPTLTTSTSSDAIGSDYNTSLDALSLDSDFPSGQQRTGPARPTTTTTTTTNTPLQQALENHTDLILSNVNCGLVTSGDIRQGMILKVYKDQMIPADMILLGSSEQKNHCFIDKANLNGETQLEVMNGIPALKQYYGNTTGVVKHSQSGLNRSPSTSTEPSSLSHTDRGYDVDLHLQCDLPNGDFESFRGHLTIFQHHNITQAPVVVNLSIRNLLLRETILRNSNYIYGLVVSTGTDTKIRQSILVDVGKRSGKHDGKQPSVTTSKVKVSSIVRAISKIVKVLFCLQITLCVIAGWNYSRWLQFEGEKHWYLRFQNSLSENLVGAFFAALSWMIVINTFVPISLLITLEITRLVTTKYIIWDRHMTTSDGLEARCNTSTIHDDLGQIDIVYSDKTGTLTQNSQELRFLSVAIHSQNEAHRAVDYAGFQAMTGVAQQQDQDKGYVAPHNRPVFIAPLFVTSSFEAFGSLYTDIAIKVMNKKGQNTGQSTTPLDKFNTPIPPHKFPPNHPLAYSGLPERWSAMLLKSGAIKPVRLVVKKKSFLHKLLFGKQRVQTAATDDLTATSTNNTKPLKLSQLMHNAYKYGNPFRQPGGAKASTDPDNHTAVNIKSGPIPPPKQYGVSSHLFDSAQGRGYYKWIMALREVQRVKIGLDKAQKLQRNHSDPTLFMSSAALNGVKVAPIDADLVSTFGVSRTLHQLAAQELLNPVPDHQNKTTPVAIAHRIPTLSPPSLLPSPDKITARLFFEKQYYFATKSLLGTFREDSRTAILTALWSKNWAHLPEYQSQNIYIAPYEVRAQLFRYIRSLALSTTVKPFRKPDGSLDWQATSSEELAMVRFAAALGFYLDVHPSGEGTVLFIREFFRPAFDIVNLAPLWPPAGPSSQTSSTSNSSYEDQSGDNHFGTVGSAFSINSNDNSLPIQQRYDPFVLPRSPDEFLPTSPSTSSQSGTQDDLSTRAFQKLPSRIHAESYSTLAVCGFSSARARVSVILQRNPQPIMPVNGVYGSSILRSDQNNNGGEADLPQLLEFDSADSLEGFQTINNYSTYSSEYDRTFRNQSQLMVNMHPYDTINDNEVTALAKTSDSYRAYPNQNGDFLTMLPAADQEDPSLSYLTTKNYITVLTKGQDVTTLPLLSDSLVDTTNPTYTNPHHVLQQQLANMESSSLRCLVCAFAELPLQWWSQYRTVFDYVTNLELDTVLSFSNLNAAFELLDNSNDDAITLAPVTMSQPAPLTVSELQSVLFNSIEQSASLGLLGCFGMEDKLQDLVPETIRDLRRAGIRVWMITGDKLDVAKNIALACELIDADMVAPGGENNSFSTQPTTGYPSCVTNFPSQRLVRVTGEWLQRFQLNREHLLGNIFDSLVQVNPARNNPQSHQLSPTVLPTFITLGYLQSCLAQLGIDVSTNHIYLLFVSSPNQLTSGLINTTIPPTTQITKAQFISGLSLIGDSISDRDSITVDIAQGLNVYQRLSLQSNGNFAEMPPISLLINRHAFTIMFQSSSDAAANHNSFQTKRFAQYNRINATNHQYTMLHSSTPSHHPIPHATIPVLAQKFFILSLFAKSVVFARAEPAMKKKMITSARHLFPNATTLAIGDGANDVDMITAAHIGVGIAGFEGSAASNSADYAIGTFRMLHRLLLVHGITYRRLEKVILLMFYKGAMIALTYFFYGFHSSFNGSQLFIDLLYQMYNTLYTAGVIFYLISHQSVPNPVLENSPAIYREIKANSFSIPKLALHILKAFIHAAIIFYVPALPLLYDGNDLVGGAALHVNPLTGLLDGQRGRPMTTKHLSTLQLAALAIVPNILALFLVESIHVPFLIVAILSALSIFPFFAFLTTMRFASDEMYHEMRTIFLDPKFWLLLFITVMIPVMMEVLIYYISNHCSQYPGLLHLLKERLYLRENESKFGDRTIAKTANSTSSAQKPLLQTVRNFSGPARESHIELGDSVAHSSDDTNSRDNHAREGTTSYTITNLPTGSSFATINHPASNSNNTASSNHHNSGLIDLDLHSILSPQDESPNPLLLTTSPYDPDPTAIYSSEFWGEAGGFGIRASAIDELVVADQRFNPNDKMNSLTLDAQNLLDTISSDELNQPQSQPGPCENQIFIPSFLEHQHGGDTSAALAAMHRDGIDTTRLPSRLSTLLLFRILLELGQKDD